MSDIADRLRLDMILYAPILQARLGEFAALDHVPAGEFVNLMPLFEVPTSKRGTIADTYSFFKRTSERLPAELRIAVDLHGHPDFLPGTRQPTIGLLEWDGVRGGLPLPVSYWSIERLRFLSRRP